MRRILRVQLFAITLFAGVVLSNPSSLCGASNPVIISPTGQSLSSLFEGLKPGVFPRAQLLSRNTINRASRAWMGMLPHRLPGVTPVHITEGGCGPGSVCAGHFNNFQLSSDNCTVGSGCSVQDSYTDTGAPCSSGEQDSYCETVQGACCLDQQYCPNPWGCP